MSASGRNTRFRPLDLALHAAVAAFLAIADCHASAQPPAPPPLHEMLMEGIDLAGKQRYAQARYVFDEVIRKNPQHPAGYLHQAMLLEVMSLDFETPVPQPEYDRLLGRAAELAEKMLGTKGGKTEALYYLGMAESYRAYERFRDGGANWIQGLQYGLKAARRLAQCLERDPNAYDAMTGLGVYLYWKSRRMKFLTWTPLVDDEREKGIRLLHTAQERGRYTAAQAANALVWIYIEEERYTDAARAARSALRSYPSNRLFLWGLASAAEEGNDLVTALDAYRRIVASLDTEVIEPRYIEIQARAKIARLSFRLGDVETARRECEWVLAHSSIDLSHFTADGAKRIRRRRADMEALRKELP
ncbi:MAG: tetratricopeptide repeat protein [Bacteroidota bacterium]|nr:tetratricopeptide repeat protein [Bacteroidota bacterium]